MTALTVGITSARDATCKRGIGANLAAIRARAVPESAVCAVDADPRGLDVTTRFAVRGPYLEDFAERVIPARGLAVVHEPPLHVLPSAGAGFGLAQRGATRALPHLRAHFDFVVCDLPAGPTGPGRVLGRLDHLDWLLVAVTADIEPVELAVRLFEDLDDATARGDLAPTVRMGVVTTGDESTADLHPDVVERALGRPVLGSLHQLWGRAIPNRGFGATLGIDELDDAADALFRRLGLTTGETGDASQNHTMCGPGTHGSARKTAVSRAS